MIATWINRMLGKRPPEEQVFYDAAQRVFKEISEGDNATASVQKANPGLRAVHWKNIESVVRSVLNETDVCKRTLLLRGLLAKYVELIVTDHWYTNLPEPDRDLVAKAIFSSDRNTQDENYYFSFANDFAIGSVLDFFITAGWEGSEASKQQIKLAKEKFIEQCKEHCGLILKIAKARDEGRELLEFEKNMGQVTVTLKEGFRRMLAGEEVLEQA